MMLFAANMDGQGAVAIQAAKDLAKLSNDSSQQVLSLVRFGRFDEVVEIENRPMAEVNAGMWDFAQGYAHLKLGNLEQANAFLTTLRETTETTEARYRFHEGRNILGALLGILEGEMAWQTGDLEAALAAFRRGTESYDRLTYDEPEPLPFSPRHWLGAVYLELDAYDSAIETFETDLEDHPHNGWSLFGIQQALAAQGRRNPEIDRRFEEAWARADTWLISPKF
jgi:tetratricopeptide (TPR) repeat protein